MLQWLYSKSAVFSFLFTTDFLPKIKRFQDIFRGAPVLAKVKSFALDGLLGCEVDVEVDINSGIPSFDLVGLPSAATKESKERVYSAIKNSGFLYPVKRITVNLAPADLKKEGPGFDLAIAVSLLAASDQIPKKLYKDFIMLGELSLDGRLRHIDGVLPVIISAVQSGYTKFIVPKENAPEASYIERAEVYALESLREAAALLSGGEGFLRVEPRKFENIIECFSYPVDFADVKGQAFAKRGLEIAVSGGHNVIMSGPPGTGKTLLAQCVPTIMPDMTFEEAVEVAKIHSVAGILDSRVGIVTARPFRTPHHSATIPALVGGGAKSRPGEVSLAHNGVLFLDEMPEYSRRALESLRQSLEDRKVTVSRVQRTVDYPADFMLIASMNPCPCGNYGSKTKECSCTSHQIRQYMSRLSGPLLDRIDLQIEVDNITYDELRTTREGERSAEIKSRANRAREIQRNRFASDGILTNSAMTNALIKKYCALDSASERLLERAYQKLALSARGAARILKVARTIADLDGSADIAPKHIGEAVQYRMLDKKYYG
jgi:magnesium chelatase family protein